MCQKAEGNLSWRQKGHQGEKCGIEAISHGTYMITWAFSIVVSLLTLYPFYPAQVLMTLTVKFVANDEVCMVQYDALYEWRLFVVFILLAKTEVKVGRNISSEEEIDGQLLHCWKWCYHTFLHYSPSVCFCPSLKVIHSSIPKNTFRFCISPIIVHSDFQKPTTFLL